VRRFFVPRTKARIQRKETTNKIPDDLDKLLGPVPKLVSKENVTGPTSPGKEPRPVQELQPQATETANGESTALSKPADPESKPETKSDLVQFCSGSLKKRMKDFRTVFKQGEDKESLMKAKDLASEIVGLTSIILQQMEKT